MDIIHAAKKTIKQGSRPFNFWTESRRNLALSAFGAKKVRMSSHLSRTTSLCLDAVMFVMYLSRKILFYYLAGRMKSRPLN